LKQKEFTRDHQIKTPGPRALKKSCAAEKHFHRSICMSCHQSKEIEIIKNDSLKKFDLSGIVLRS
jgi:hypothetical protein